MRGELSKARLRRIGSLFPSATVELHKAFPAWARQFIGSKAATEPALRALWDGWHLLCEANLALYESEACWVWYSELRNPPNQRSAAYFCRYYLDDAALRLAASLWHMLTALRDHLKPRRAKAKGKGRSQLDRIVAALAAARSKSPVLGWLRALQDSGAWRECSDYRNRWCHYCRPAVAGLGPILTYARLDLAPGVQGFSSGTTQPVDHKIEDLRQSFRRAYVALLSAYLKVMKLMSPSRSSLPAIRPMLVPRRKSNGVVWL